MSMFGFGYIFDKIYFDFAKPVPFQSLLKIAAVIQIASHPIGWIHIVF